MGVEKRGELSTGYPHVQNFVSVSVYRVFHSIHRPYYYCFNYIY